MRPSLRSSKEYSEIFLLCTLLLFVFVRHVRSQDFISPDDCLLNGFERKVTGFDFDYHSCIPGLRESMLIRAMDGTDFMEWETEKTPDSINEKQVTYFWIAALGSSPGEAEMNLTVNNSLNFLFYTDGRPEWEIAGEQGSALGFHSIMADQYGDHHGYMYLKMPISGPENGKPVKIRVTGSKSGLSSWYMTFKKPVKTGLTLNSFPAVIKSGKELLQLVEAGVFYFGQKTEAAFFTGNKLLLQTKLEFGYNSVNLGLPKVARPTEVEISVKAENFNASRVVTLNPVKEWKVNFIQHSHTDIGYTRSQTEILAEHLRYIDYALDYCDATDHYPDNAKFRWTCEASWPVDEFLKVRPAGQVERLVRRIREGRIEVTGMYYNFSELPDEQILAASLDAVARMKTYDIPVTLAMQNDVNGIAWCMNDYFEGLGVKYLNMGTHGHRALICFGRPTLFWWESPSGKRMLAFRAEHYMTGNTLLEMQTGDMARFKNNLLKYLNDLDAKGYPYNQAAIQHSGYLTDNSPPSTTASELIRQWNELYEWPRLTTSTAENFFVDMETSHGSEFPVIRGAWPDWWADGLAASAREVAATRQAAASLLSTISGLSMASLAGIKLPEGTDDEIDLANNALLFYSEHTTGYSESIREPFSQPTMEQRALKDSYAWEANRRVALLGETAMGLLQSRFSREPEPSLLVFNTLNWKRSGLTTVYIDHQLISRDKKAGIFDHEGNRLPVQALSHRSDGTYWAVWLRDIPPFGYRKFIVRPLEETGVMPDNNPAGVLENEWYRIVTDKEKGTIVSWYDKALSKELVDAGSEYKMGEFILEQLNNRDQLEARHLTDFKRSPPDTIWFDAMSQGEIWNSIRFYGETESAVGARGFSFEIRLYNSEKRVDLAYSINKKSITDPEGFYIAFPFSADGGKHFTELPGGVIETGRDQIRGSSNDWYTVQNFTALRSSSSQIVLGCPEMPLMQFGAINTGRFEAGAMPQSSHLFSWPMNNYWTTNFNADQRGGHSWTYYLTSSADTSNGFSTKFGWGCRVPFLTRVIPGSGTGTNIREGSFIENWPENTLLISAMPAQNGSSILIHLRETDGIPAVLKLVNGLTGKPLSVIEVDVSGNPLSKPDNMIGPLESKFYRVLL